MLLSLPHNKDQTVTAMPLHADNILKEIISSFSKQATFSPNLLKETGVNIQLPNAFISGIILEVPLHATAADSSQNLPSRYVIKICE